MAIERNAVMKKKGVTKGFKWQSSDFDSLNEKSKKLPISSLHMGLKAKHLKDYGVVNLEDLIREFREGLREYKYVGKPTMESWFNILVVLAKNVTEDGDVDWVGFTNAMEITLIPNCGVICDGIQLLNVIPEVITQLISSSEDDVEAAILTERLSRTHSEQLTLEQLGKKFGITRERIRQKEFKLLNRLVNALLYDEYTTLDYRFSPYFSDYFKNAAKSFSGVTEITLDGFISTICNTWDVAPSDISCSFPLITSILTNQSIIPQALRAENSLPLILFEDLPHELDENSLNHLRLGKITDHLENSGFSSIHEIIIAEQKQSMKIGPTDRKALLDYLNKIAETIKGYDSDGDFWYQFACKNSMEIMPSQDTLTIELFLDSLKPVLIRLLESDFKYGYAVDIFNLRTSQPKSLRYTIDRVGNEAGTHGSCVKRNETLLVKFLHRQLIEKDFRFSSIYLRPSFLNYWSDIWSIYQENKNEFTQFKLQLMSLFGRDDKLINKYSDLLWTICNIYPAGRNVLKHRQKINNDKPKLGEGYGVEVKPVLIKLRGFKHIF